MGGHSQAGTEERRNGGTEERAEVSGWVPLHLAAHLEVFGDPPLQRNFLSIADSSDNHGFSGVQGDPGDQRVSQL